MHHGECVTLKEINRVHLFSMWHANWDIKQETN